MGTPPSECVAYNDFRDLLVQIRSQYTHLNPGDGKLFKHVSRTSNPFDKELDDTGMEFVRGGIVAIMSAWESYVHDLFEEAFAVVTDVSSRYRCDESSLARLQDRWPACRTIIENEIKQQAAQKCKDHVEVLTYELLQEGDQQSGSRKKTWKIMMDAHCDRVLHGKTLLPIFSCRGIGRENTMSMDELFRQLFKVERQEKSLSDILIEIGVFSFEIMMPGTRRVSLKPAQSSDRSAVEALCNISRLYYGLRCAFVHGKHRKTLEGALKDFPDNPDSFPLPTQNDEIKTYYVNLYKRIKEHGRKADVSYLTFINLSRFYGTAAYALMLAIAKWFYDLQPDDGQQVRIWGYNPRIVLS